MGNRDLSFSRSMIWVLVITLLISGSGLMGWLYFLQMRDKRVHDEQYRTVAIVQRSGQPEFLKTAYLAELLELSIDKPTNLYAFDLKQGREKLLGCPLVKKAQIKKILPGTLFIHYEMRTPYALCGDFDNAAFDREGIIFPYAPFYTPKYLPVIFLGIKDQTQNWGKKVTDSVVFKKASAILETFQHMQGRRFFVSQVDLSAINADSYGQRKLVMVLKNNREDENQSLTSGKIYLKLSPDHYEKEMINFLHLYDFLKIQTPGYFSQDAVIDFRIEQLAFIKFLKE